MDRKLKRQLNMAIVSVILSFLMLGSATFAWFSNNRKTDSSGLQMNIQTTANLEISATTTFAGATSVTLTGVTRKLSPAMHVTNGGSNLQTVKQTVPISKTTGLSSEALGADDYEAVALSVTSPYYVDYTVYIACEGRALADGTLTAAITLPEADGDLYRKAASIDFYVDDVYGGTLNLAGLDVATNDTGYSGTAKTEAVIFSGRIPCESDSAKKYLTVTMRCYFDGSLHRTASETFVTTANNMTTSGLSLGVSFTADGTEADAN